VDPRHPEEVRAGILEALTRPRGIIPEGLSYFSFENFAERCRRLLRQIANPG
jgi:phosphatidylinositol alpha-1,6-mannosyltransferase